jgi:hypothetical protein
MTPTIDTFPPILRDTILWEQPIPMPGPVNTSGCEDSPFIVPDGSSFYFFFTPDIRVPVDKQLLDSVTGIYWATRTGSDWTEPERVVLNNDLSMDGAEFVQGDTMWFASVRTGNFGEIDIYQALLKSGRWGYVKNAGRQLNRDYDIGEFCLSPDGRTIYFGWNQPGGYGGLDIWKADRSSDTWGPPVNLGPGVNSADDENQPCLTPDGRDLWFTRNSQLGVPGPACWRSMHLNDSWGVAEEVVSRFAGEPTLDSAGNLYFVHHYMTSATKIIEADIYVAYRRQK